MTAPFPRRFRRPFALGLAAVALVAASDRVASADDKSGVSPTRLSLPKGPGSIGGIGENAEPNYAMGLMDYGVPIDLPKGYDGLTPSLRLAYNSGAQSSVVGLGWALATPSIERMTSRELPKYTGQDDFVANGSDELVRIGSSQTYRARYESAFVRYTWVDPAGTGSAGYWKAEYPDGTIGHFGGRSTGVTDYASQVRGPSGVFRYMLTELVDRLGHKTTFDYVRSGANALLQRIAYVYEGTQPRYQVLLSYEARPDLLSDARPGFELVIARRLVGIQVLSHGAQLRRYALAYESVDTSGGLSRLASIKHYGVGDQGPYPVQFGLRYSAGLNAACTGTDCNVPVMVTIGGNIAADLRAGAADLVDLNGDALPDVVDTQSGTHQIHINRPGVAGFAPSVASATSNTSLTSPKVDMIDLDGDGYTDMYDAASHVVLFNKGKGDWEPPQTLSALDVPDRSADANLRFVDYNHDRRIDLVHSDGTFTWYYENTGGGHFQLVSDPSVANIGASFTTGGLQLADMNGDGLLDPVEVGAGAVQYRLNMGFGRLGPWKAMTGVGADVNAGASLVDLNGDGLSDVVIVKPGAVEYALNRNAADFLPPVTLGGALNIPIDPTYTVRFADMNGNGSTDIAWFEPSGTVVYLELFPVRPNLLTRIDNGIGIDIEVQYGFAAQHMAQDGGPQGWQYRTPFPLSTVDVISAYDTLSGVRNTRRLHYANGYYDGLEKQFRGFTSVDEVRDGDADAETALRQLRFEVGQIDPYRKNLLLSEALFSAGRELRADAHVYGDCTVAAAAPTAVPVRFVCPLEMTRVIKEGAAQAQWVTTHESYLHDGYGNQTTLTNDGIVGKTGDERIEQSVYIDPAQNQDAWMPRKAVSKRVYGAAGSTTFTEEIFHYDGAPFVGLPAGQVTQGLVTRAEARVDGATFIDERRNRFDANGAVVETMDPNGHRRTFTYDTAGLLPTSETAWLDGAGHDPYGLQMTATYDRILDTVLASTSWTRVQGGAVVGTPRTTSYTWDAFGRMTAIARPGDSLTAPTEQMEYDLAAPISRLVHSTRSASGGALDVQDVQCFDGQGRKLQTRHLIGPGRYQTDGFHTYDAAGGDAREYQPYAGTLPDCDHAPPAGVRYTEHARDAAGRETKVVVADADLFGGTASVKSTTYLPFETIGADFEDGPDGAFAGTALVTTFDGLGRVVGYDRFTGATTPLHTRLAYDDLGNLRAVVDPGGNTKTQEYDRLGRVVKVSDPDTGVTTTVYDAAGNRTAVRDGRGVTTGYAYDELDRLLADWDTANQAATAIQYQYDAVSDCAAGKCANLDGMLARVSYPAGDGSEDVDRLGYDARGQAVYLSRTLDGTAYELTTAFDNAGRAVARTYPNGRTIPFALDGDARLTAIPGFVTSVAYDDRGATQAITLGNGASTSYTYDARMGLAAIDTLTADGAVQAYRYTRDRVGNIRAIDDVSANLDGASEAAQLTYDPLYRLVSAHLDPGRPAYDETLTMQYDAADNLVSKTSSLGAASSDHVGAYVYGQNAGPHAVTTAGATSLAYDGAGNAVTHGVDAYAWDFKGRLASATRAGAPLASFTYGAGIDRVKKVEQGHTTYYVAPDYEVRDGVATIYVSVGDERVARIETTVATAPASASAAWAAQTRGDSPSAILAASSQAQLAAASDRVTYLHHNHAGTTTVTTDGAGHVVARLAAYPFGAARYESGGLDEEYIFTGKERDGSTGLTYFGARYLDPHLGNWVAADPLFATLTASESAARGSRYAYAGYNPFGRIDPDGRLDFDISLPKNKYVDFKLSLSDKSGLTVNLAEKKLNILSISGNYNRATDAYSADIKFAPEFQRKVDGERIKGFGAGAGVKAGGYAQLSIVKQAGDSPQGTLKLGLEGNANVNLDVDVKGLKIAGEQSVNADVHAFVTLGRAPDGRMRFDIGDTATLGEKTKGNLEAGGWKASKNYGISTGGTYSQDAYFGEANLSPAPPPDPPPPPDGPMCEPPPENQSY